ncbi:MAG: hypothetical protein GXO79_11800 [Chlorobi bacterium]|nr:hypothetical protein [Chlorobiota bacterium]
MKLIKNLSYIFVILVFFSCNKEDNSLKESVRNYDNIVCNNVIKNTDGTYALVGSQYNINNGKDLLISKFSTEYDLKWSYVYEKEFNQSGTSLVETGDGYIAVGTSAINNSDSTNLLIVKINNNGEFVWQKEFFKSQNFKSKGNDIIEALDNNYIITGELIPYNYYEEQTISNFIIKISSSGDSIAGRIYIGNGFSIIKKSDNYLISGSNSIFIIKEDLSLYMAYSFPFKAVKSQLYLNNDNSFLCYGNTGLNNSFIIKYNSDFDSVWSKQYNLKHIVALTQHGLNTYLTGYIPYEYFNELLIGEIDNEGNMFFSTSDSSDSESIRYSKEGKKVFYLEDKNRFLIWENYNQNKLSVYEVNQTGKLIQ